VTFTSSPDWWSREQVFVTLQRGALGPTFECYPAPKNGGSLADCSIVWTVAAADVNDSVIKVDSQTLPSPIGVAVTAATAGSGSASWGAGGVLGASSFASSENWLAMLRCSALSTLTAFQTNFAVLQAAGAFAAYDGTDNSGYGVAQNVVYATSQGGAGYLRFDQRFISAASDQVHEAEDMRFVASGTTSQVADGTASGGQYVQDSQTSSVNYTIYKASTNLLGARYRVFARCKVGGGSSGGAFVPYINGTSTAGALTASTSWVWLDLGEVLAAAAGGFLAVAAWTPSGGWAAVDRVEVYLVEDRTSLAPIYGGARDLGASTLYDSRTFGALVAR
jgi:hypothetical protein